MPSGRRARVFIVDDSAVMRSLLRSVIGSDPGLELAGAASDGKSALASIESLRPDLILLDVEMPVMDGLATLRQLRARNARIPVIMCSSLTHRGAKVTIEALAGGASDYVAKPTGHANLAAASQALAQDLLPKIHALTSSVAGSPSNSAASRPELLPAMMPPATPLPIPSVLSVMVIGVSTGGPAALDMLLPALPASFPLPVLIVQHMPELFTQLLAERLAQRCPLKVKEASEGDQVRPGTIHIARGNWHLEVLAGSRPGGASTLHLTQNAPENHCRPAADVLFRTAVQVYGSGVLAVVLTGMGSDGLAGVRLIRAQGGAVFAQDQASSTVWGMPGAVVRAGLAHRVLPLAAVVPEILQLVSRSQSEARELRETAAF
jgi:two-component system chemotaxis response regulator CheB